jgi:Flp pilus assembly pilin Flp
VTSAERRSIAADRSEFAVTDTEYGSVTTFVSIAIVAGAYTVTSYTYSALSNEPPSS